jgi:sarcosine oxidase subunit gamma
MAETLSLQRRTGLQIASLAARKGQDAALAARVAEIWGLALPVAPRWVGDAGLTILWSGPGQWLVVAHEWTNDLEADLRDRLGTLAVVADQSHGRAVLRLRGARARDVLAKGMGIDLHPRAFAPGDTALTLLAQMGVQIWQIDETPGYDLAVFGGFAYGLQAWLLAAGAEHGIALEAP